MFTSRYKFGSDLKTIATKGFQQKIIVSDLLPRLLRPIANVYKPLHLQRFFGQKTLQWTNQEAASPKPTNRHLDQQIGTFFPQQ